MGCARGDQREMAIANRLRQTSTGNPAAWLAGARAWAMVGRAAYGFGWHRGRAESAGGGPVAGGPETTKYPTRVYRIAIRSARGGRSCIYRKEHAKPASQETPRLDKQSGEAATCRAAIRAAGGTRPQNGRTTRRARAREVHERHQLAPGRDPATRTRSRRGRRSRSSGAGHQAVRCCATGARQRRRPRGRGGNR